MVEEGVVSGIKDGRLIVNIRRRPACGSCRACGMAEDKVMKLELENTIGAREGDRVNIELDDSVILKGAFLFYGAPLLGLVAGIFIGKVFSAKINFVLPDEAASALLGIILMCVAFMAAGKYNSVNKEGLKPRVSKA